MRLRTKFSLAFALVPLAVGVPSYLIREHFGMSPNTGYLENIDLHWMVLSSLMNAPLLGLAAHIAWPLFGSCRDNLFFKSFIGNMVFGFLLPITALLALLIATVLFTAGLRYLGISPMDSPIFSIPIFAFLPIWGSYFLMMVAGGMVGMVFGRLQGRREGFA
mgnify:FL=1